ncbi:MAG: hypothetical protein M3540_10625 [Actinomycetota bacterium]|nr:hypothetical protein [Actinomycetota bacterium]
MKLEITPEPSPAEREAIEHALTRVLAAARGQSPWREAGVRENTKRSHRHHPGRFDADAISPPGSGRGAASQ